MKGTIRGRKDRGHYGKVVVNADGSVTLYNVVLENIVLRNCDMHVESGEYPISFADRMNQLMDWASQDEGAYPFYVGGQGGEKVVPGDERDTFDRGKAKAQADAQDVAESATVFGVEEVQA